MIRLYDLPPAFLEEMSNEPFKGKYSDCGTDNAVYLLYCDFSTSQKWIKDSTQPKSFFSHYIKAIQLLKELTTYNSSYQFSIPTPQDQLNDLFANLTVNTNSFSVRSLNCTLKAANKLKTDKAKDKKINSFFHTLLVDYSDYLTKESKKFIEDLKKENSVIPITNNAPVFCGQYDVSSVIKIRDIPNDDTSVIRLLQKAATDHKRNGNWELAIECLRKSNQISDSCESPFIKLMPKEYFRIIKYMNMAGYENEAKEEEKHINAIHPELNDKRISNLPRILQCISRAKELQSDVVFITTDSTCPFCKHINKKKFSISGNDKRYPKLPQLLTEQGGFCNECIVGISIDYSDILNESFSEQSVDEKILDLAKRIKTILRKYQFQEEDTPSFTRIHIYDNSNRKLGIVKITKPDMKMTFKIPGNPTLNELNSPEDIKRFL